MSVVTVGNFDGVHLGHQKIIDTLHQYPELKKVIITFNPHSLDIYTGEKNKCITAFAEKVALLTKAGRDQCTIDWISEPIGTDHFIKDILLDKYDCHVLVMGANNTIGPGMGPDAVRELGLFKIHVVDLYQGISSTSIKKHLVAGEFQLAEEKLARKFSFTSF